MCETVSSKIKMWRREKERKKCEEDKDMNWTLILVFNLFKPQKWLEEFTMAAHEWLITTYGECDNISFLIMM